MEGIQVGLFRERMLSEAMYNGRCRFGSKRLSFNCFPYRGWHPYANDEFHHVMGSTSTYPSRPHITRSYLLEGYERDHSLYPRRLSTFECGSEPIGDAMIQFHFQYYWYAIVFLVFDVAFMFLVLGGVVTAEETNKGTKEAIANAEAGLAVLAVFFAIMSLGVWYVFRKRGRIYI